MPCLTGKIFQHPAEQQESAGSPRRQTSLPGTRVSPFLAHSAWLQGSVRSHQAHSTPTTVAGNPGAPALQTKWGGLQEVTEPRGQSPRAGPAPGTAGRTTAPTGSIDACSPAPLHSLKGFRGQHAAPSHALAHQGSWHTLPFTQPYRRAWPSTAGWEGCRWPVQVLPICSPSRLFQRKTLEVIVLFSIKQGYPVQLALGGALLKATAPGEGPDQRGSEGTSELTS